MSVTLPEFITARLDEMEKSATALLVDLEAQIRDNGFGADERGPFTPSRMLSSQLWAHYDGQTRWRNFARGQHIATLADPARVLAVVEAHRKIVAEYEAAERRCHDQFQEPEGVDWNLGRRQGAWAALRALASIWSDHPDYDPAWAA